MTSQALCGCSPSVPHLNMQTREWSCQVCGMALPTRARPDPNAVQGPIQGSAVPPPPPDNEEKIPPPPPDEEKVPPPPPNEGKYGSKKSIAESAKKSRAVAMATSPNRRIAVAFVLLICLSMSATALLWSLRDIENTASTGKPGEEGADGQQGLSSLMFIQPEPEGQNCSNGGHAILTGIDEDRDGILDSQEVEHTSFICNGLDAEITEPGTPLTDIQTISTGGANCIDGGLLIRVGIDDDGDGNLSEDEVTAEEYLCNGRSGEDGSDGQTLETLMSSDSRATVCPDGLRTRFGVDDGMGTAKAGDQILQSDEVRSMMVLCWVQQWNQSFPEYYPGVANSFGSACDQRVDFEDWFIYTAITPVEGCELYISDGTLAGTSILKDINPTGESLPGLLTGFIAWQGRLWFDADDGVNGRELWSTDGTAEGTAMAADICPDSCSSNPENLYGFKDTLWFSADAGDGTGGELWSLDILGEKAEMIADICPGSCSSESGANGWTTLGEELFFSAEGGDGVELWAYSDSLREVSNFDSGVDPDVGQVIGLVTFEERIWFDADDGQNGRELWYSDGENLSMLEDLSGDSSSSLFSNDFGAHVVNGKLLLRTTSNGILTAVQNYSASTINGSMMNIGAGADSPVYDADGNLWFSCQSASQGMELCLSDGEVAGIIWEFMPGLASSNVRSIASMGGYIYAVAEGMNGSKNTGYELWKLTSTDSAELIFEGQSDDGADGQVGLYGGLVVVANTLFFSFDDGLRGHELYQIGFLPEDAEHLYID